jgi:hypothetical protein
MRRAAAPILAALCVAFALRGASAQEEGWVVRSFHAQIVGTQDATLSVTEEITVDFGTLERHGIIREIPYEYDYEPLPGERDEGDMHRLTTITVEGVRDGRLPDGAPVPFETDYSGGTLRIRIGDPDTTISGEQRYRMTTTTSCTSTLRATPGRCPSSAPARRSSCQARRC